MTESISSFLAEGKESLETVIRTYDLPAAERFESWLDHVSQTFVPVKVTCDDPADFQGEINWMSLGAVDVSSQLVSACEGHRTSRLIRQSDPELFQLVLNQRGNVTVTQDRKVAALRPSDLVLYHTSRPFQFHTRTDTDGELVDGVIVVFPNASLPLPLHKVERLTATSLSGREGIGALLTGFLTQLTAGPGQYGIADSARLGATLIDLLTTLLAHHLDAGTAVPPTTRQRVLLLRIHAFIHQHLADPSLSPATIAAAHGISIRTLHRLFQTQDATVAAWIRDQRLNRCRRDLSDPALGDRPIHAIATRWGFTDATNFSHAFSTAYGLNPQNYRRHLDQSARALK